MVFGYASDETEEYMPIAISLAHSLAKRLSEVRKNNTLPYLRPDGKTQVSIRYENDTAVFADNVLVSTQHNPDVSQEQIREDIIREVITPVIPEKLLSKETKILINPTGRFVIGGPVGDSGLTGRKIIVDTYGGSAHHGGGAFSGKDPTKVDRSAAYAADMRQKISLPLTSPKRQKFRLLMQSVLPHQFRYISTHSGQALSPILIFKK